MTVRGIKTRSDHLETDNGMGGAVDLRWVPWVAYWIDIRILQVEDSLLKQTTYTSDDHLRQNSDISIHHRATIRV